MPSFEKFDQTQIEPAEFQVPVAAAQAPRFTLTKGHIALFVIGLLVLLAMLFVTFARSVEVRAIAVNLNDPDSFFPLPAQINIEGLIKLPLGNRVLLLPGERRISLSADGFVPSVQTIAIGAERNQRFDIQMTRTPGKIKINLVGDAPDGLAATVQLNGRELATLPASEIDIPAGRQELTIDAPLYRPVTQSLLVQGRGEQQTLEVEMQAAWAEYQLSSLPVGARVFLDENEVGVTPITLKIEEGTHQLTIAADKYQDFNREIGVVAKQDLVIPVIELKPANAELVVQTTPAGAAVMLNQVYRGTTPLKLEVPPAQNQSIKLYKAGFEIAQNQLSLEAAEQQQVSIDLAADLIPVSVSVSPSDAQVFVDGQARGSGSQRLQLSSLPHKVSVRKAGYVTQNFDLIPTRATVQVITANLLTEEEHYWAQLPDNYTNRQGHQLTLFKDLGQVRLGSSRREDGRRANEAQYTARLTRPFYVALHETTNKQFRAFRAQHTSGNFKNKSLDANRAPVVNITWQDAAKYCNWLSLQEGLDPFYRTTKGFIADVNEGANGYRLLTEAEWAWLARNKNNDVLVYPWGSAKEPPANRIGNYADKGAADLIAFHLPNYEDGYVGPSPVGRFDANHRGIFDLDGNVSEWTNDWYSAKGSSELTNNDGLVDPLGPEEGEFRVVRGASWARGHLPQLRLAYRDFASKGKHDIGFRVARYAGLNKK